MSEEQTTLRRDMIADLVSEASESEAPTTATETVVDEQPKTDRPRDEVGRFAKADQEAKEAQQAQEQTTQEVEKPKSRRPSSWKKDYWEVWDKLESGQPTTPEETSKLLAYINQREGEFASGVSTYRQEAESAKELRQAIEPFMPQLQQYGIKPTDWIQNLGRAHQALALGTPEQKVEMFQRLAREYGIQFDGMGQAQQVDPQLQMLTRQVQQLQSGWQSFQTQAQRQEEDRLMEHIKQFQEDDSHPHFETVREQMAQLLGAGLAPDLQTAYEMAVWSNAETRTLELQRQQQGYVQQAAQAAAKAKAKAISPRSGTPQTQANANANKDRRTLIAEQLTSASRV